MIFKSDSSNTDIVLLESLRWTATDLIW